MQVPHDDPWMHVTTSAGHAADEVISALQKSIRRADLENAMLCALDMAATSVELESVLWDRLVVIAVEDVGLASPDTIVVVEACCAARQRFADDALDKRLFIAHAIRTLVTAPKDRSSDELVNLLVAEMASGRTPEIIDAALDMHTRRGRELGRGLDHFLKEASQVRGEAPGRSRDWRARLLERLGLPADEA